MRRIQALLILRHRADQTTEFHHINSHLIDVTFEELSEKKQKQLQNMKRLFPTNWEYILTGNKEVDLLVSQTLLRTDQKTSIHQIGLPKFLLIDRNLEPITGNANRIIKTKSLNLIEQAWFLKCPLRTNPMHNPNIDWQRSIWPLKSKEHNKLIEVFQLKLKLKILPLKKRVFKKISRYKETNTWPPKLLKRKILLEKTYSDDHCPLCKKQGLINQETHDHFTQCPLLVYKHNKLAEKILKKAQEFNSNLKLNMIPWWFTTSFVEEGNNPLLTGFRAKGDFGLIPTALWKFWKEHTPTKEETMMDFIKIHTAKTMYSKWTKRTRTLYPNNQPSILKFFHPYSTQSNNKKT
jgi:hypothetical protein